MGTWKDIVFLSPSRHSIAFSESFLNRQRKSEWENVAVEIAIHLAILLALEVREGEKDWVYWSLYTGQ